MQTGAARSASLPDLPTVAESGFPGFDAEAFWGVLGPAGVPAPVLARFQPRWPRRWPSRWCASGWWRARGWISVGATPGGIRRLPRPADGDLGAVVRERGIKAE